MSDICGWTTIGRNLLHDPTVDIASVIKRTEHTDTGITYEVLVTLRDADSGDGERIVWIDEVTFGMTDATCSGGGAFVLMAREQDKIADRLWSTRSPELRQAARFEIGADVLTGAK